MTLDSILDTAVLDSNFNSILTQPSIATLTCPFVTREGPDEPIFFVARLGFLNFLLLRYLHGVFKVEVQSLLF